MRTTAINPSPPQPDATGGQRADVALVALGVFESRAKARDAIEAGRVRVGGRPLTRPSTIVGAADVFEAEPAHPWVSRGGLKLVAALDAFGFDPTGLVCLDIGSSTGGFTHVLLDRGAAAVTAVDVGQAQLHASLRGDARVRVLEGTDARTLDAGMIGSPPALIVCDASFISLTKLLPPVLALAAPVARLVCLVKPQFEAGPARRKKGVVRDASSWDQACRLVADAVSGLGWTIVGLRPSPIEGREGNREFLLGATQGIAA